MTRKFRRSLAGMSWLIAILAMGLATDRLLPSAHAAGPEGFDCDDGPFGLPSLALPTSEIGEWGPVTTWPGIAMHAALLSSGKVLLFEIDAAYLWDHTTPLIEPDPIATPVPSSGTSTFHGIGHSTLHDGRVIIAGGTDNQTHPKDVHLFDPVTETFTRVSDMNFGRYYPTLTALPNGQVLATSGKEIQNPTAHATIPEVYDAVTDSWKQLPSADLELRLYPQMFVLPDGKVFKAGPKSPSQLLDIDAQKWEVVATPNSFGAVGSAAAYGPTQIIKMGSIPVTAEAEVIDLSDASPAWRGVPSMDFPRLFADLTLLPDGQILVAGGSVEGTATPECAVHAPEMWDPVSELWTTMASAERPRIYHSFHLLLPDGRVLAAGGKNFDAPGGEKNAEVYSPPYLFKGPRPAVTASPAVVSYDQVFGVDTPDAASIVSVALLRPGSVTHSFDQNQRYVSLPFSIAGSGLEVTSPLDANAAPPGDYMLFLVNTAGVPSIAPFVRLAHACNDGSDNDSNSLTDFPADPGCNSLFDVSEGPDCSDGVDNDGDGLTDLADPGCIDGLDTTETSNALVCDDGLDNDGDAIVDFPNDPGCTSALDPDETEASLICDDGLDNDGDELIDFPADDGCDGLKDPGEGTDTSTPGESPPGLPALGAWGTLASICSMLVFSVWNLRSKRTDVERARRPTPS